MAKAIYYYDNGTGTKGVACKENKWRGLTAVPCETDAKGNLTKPGESTPFCTGGVLSPVPAPGCYVLASAAASAPGKKGKKKTGAETETETESGKSENGEGEGDGDGEGDEDPPQT